ncbi:MAG: nickel-dependent hydrogenase large subunit [Caulobacteraceae bacterium]
MTWTARAVDEAGWRAATNALAAGRFTLAGLWGGAGLARMALHSGGEAAILTLACPTGIFPSVGSEHAPAIRLERALADLHGLKPAGATDIRPWLDHGRWPVRHPLGAAEPSLGPTPYPFLRSEGESLHQIPVGPVHAGVIEPGHFRFTAAGETVVLLEERLGYVHRGLESLMIGADLDAAAKLAARACGDSTVAYGIAFARAAETAMGLEPPTRAVWLRALMAELERLANHLGDIGAICNDAAFALMHAHCAALREQLLRAADAAFGHRLMMDLAVPGGVADDLSAAGREAIGAVVKTLRARFPLLVRLYDDTATLQDRTVGTGVVAPELAARFGTGGHVGRACGRAFDARKAFPYPPYDVLAFEVPTRGEGDVNARVWIRIDEVHQSVALVEQLLAGLPDGPVLTSPGAASGEGAALIEGFRGDVFAWLKLEGGKVAGAYLRDPSWFQWPLLEAAIEGNIVADFPLCNKSFNCAYAGVDL